MTVRNDWRPTSPRGKRPAFPSQMVSCISGQGVLSLYHRSALAFWAYNPPKWLDYLYHTYNANLSLINLSAGRSRAYCGVHEREMLRARQQPVTCVIIIRQCAYGGRTCSPKFTHDSLSESSHDSGTPCHSRNAYSHQGLALTGLVVMKRDDDGDQPR